jgi:hypothetical protein
LKDGLYRLFPYQSCEDFNFCLLPNVTNDPNRSIHCVFQMSVQANVSVIRYGVFGIIPICLSRQKERYPA